MRSPSGVPRRTARGHARRRAPSPSRSPALFGTQHVAGVRPAVIGDRRAGVTASCAPSRLQTITRSLALGPYPLRAAPASPALATLSREGPTTVHLIVLVASLTIASPHRAPPAPNGAPRVAAARQQAPIAIDRWLTRPTRIVLTKDQQVRVDTLRAKYAAERKAVNDVVKSQGEMAAMFRMRDLDAKYQKLVRAILTPEQQAVFDENVRSNVTMPHP